MEILLEYFLVEQSVFYAETCSSHLDGEIFVNLMAEINFVLLSVRIISV